MQEKGEGLNAAEGLAGGGPGPGRFPGFAVCLSKVPSLDLWNPAFRESRTRSLVASGMDGGSSAFPLERRFGYASDERRRSPPPGKIEMSRRHSSPSMLLPALLLVFTLLAFPKAFAQEGFVIVVNSGISLDFLPKDEVSDYFLKKKSEWADGTKVDPVDLDVREVREAFSDAVHGRSLSSIKKYWQRQIFTGRGTPPPERDSDQAVLDYVSSRPGAIGYVSPRANTSVSGVKTLRIQ